jgi:hypothetical protein
MKKTLRSLTLLAAAAAFAQTAPTPPDPATQAQMRVNMLASQLNLTDAQKSSALSIFTASFTAAQNIQTSLQANRTSLSDAVKKNDTATIDQLSATAGTLTAQLTAIDSKADAAFYTLLTADQKTLYDAMPHGGPGGRGFGPGGPGALSRGRRG